MFFNSAILKAIQDLTSVVRSILKLLRLRRPGLVYLRVVGSYYEGKKKMLRFKLVLPAPGASDVVTRRLLLMIGSSSTSSDLPGDALESTEYEGSDNEVLTGTLVDVDDADNESEPREFSFVLVDTLPPPQPGEIGLVVTGEE